MNVDVEATTTVALHVSGLSSFFYCVEEMDAAAHLTMAAVAVAMTIIIAVASGLSFFFSSVVVTAASLATMAVAATTTVAVAANRHDFHLRNQTSKRQWPYFYTDKIQGFVYSNFC